MTDPVSAPDWYDVLDVDSTATTEEIRAAWRDAIADLTPADRRFRLYNQAAEVLLDPQRRAAHDATLAEQAALQEQEPGPDTAPSPPPDRSEQWSDESSSEVVRDEGPPRRVVPTWLIAGLAVLTALSVALTGYLFTQPSEGAVDDATGAARAAAEQAIKPVLSYDYRDLEASRQAALDYITSDYRDDYDKFFEGVVVPNAESTKTVVTVEVIASAVVRGDEERAQILLFVNRPTTNAETKEPVLYKDQVRVNMEKVGDEWLVDCLITTPEGEKECGS